MQRGPDANDGPQRFIRNWLTFNDGKPLRLRRLSLLIATVATFLVASALLALFSGRLPR
jgi:hypothetical protein